MGIYALKPKFRERLTRLRDLCVRVGISADALTGAAVVLSVAGGFLVFRSDVHRPEVWAIPLLAMGRITLNALDGMVAQAAGSARPFGEVLNEFADRVSDVAWIGSLSFVVDARLGLAVLVVVLLGSYLGTAAKAAGGARIYRGLMGKADRMIVMSVAAIAVWFVGREAWTWCAIAIGVGSLVTIVQRFGLAHRDLSGGPHAK